jgi:hypothetical protein
MLVAAERSEGERRNRAVCGFRPLDRWVGRPSSREFDMFMHASTLSCWTNVKATLID